jgi:hypothetical protein
VKRRTFLRLAVATAVLSPLQRTRLWAQAGLPRASIPTLRAVARVVLPKSLGARRIDATADRFVQWVAGHQAGVLTEHGYGRPRIRRTPKSPAPRYAAQLSALDEAARPRGASFDELALDAQRALLDGALKEAKVETLPNSPTGQHVVSDLMAFYFQSSEANDECYQADIGRYKCRPLSFTTAKPRPLS